MVKEELVGLFSMITLDALKNNKEEMSDKLFVGCTNDDSYEQVYSKMIMNAIDISVQASVQIVISSLCDCGIINEEYLNSKKFKPYIHIVKDDEK